MPEEPQVDSSASNSLLLTSLRVCGIQTLLEETVREAEARARAAERDLADRETEAEELRDRCSRAESDAATKTERMNELRSDYVHVIAHGLTCCWLSLCVVVRKDVLPGDNKDTAVQVGSS